VSNAPLYTPEDLAWYAREYADTPWMVHVTGSDEIYEFVDEAGTKPYTEQTAHDSARQINELAERIEREDPSPFNPEFHATVFHHGALTAAGAACAVEEGR